MNLRNGKMLSFEQRTKLRQHRSDEFSKAVFCFTTISTEKTQKYLHFIIMSSLARCSKDNIFPFLRFTDFEEL